MACPVCRTEQPGWGKYCNACGAEQSPAGVVCTGCNAGNPPGTRFCSGCGQRIALVTCLQCGALNPAERMTCAACQETLQSIEDPQRSTSSEPPQISSDLRHWNLEYQILLRIQPEGLGELIRSAPVEASRYHAAFGELLHRVAAIHGAQLLDLEDGGALIRMAVDMDELTAAVLAALDTARAIRTGLSEVAESRRQEGWSPIPVRMALYLGDLLTTGKGAGTTLLSALEGEGYELLRLCPPGELCVSEAIRNAVRLQFQERPVGLIGEGAGPWAGAYVLGEPRAPLPGASLDVGDVSPLVGRDRELAHVKRRWSDVARGGGSRMFTLVAAPGMGRGRLIEAFLTSLDDANVSHLIASCDEAAGFSPYYPFIDILYQLLHVSPADDDTTVALRLRLAARRAVAAEGWSAGDTDPEVVELAVILGEMLGIEVHAPGLLIDPGGLDPESLRQRLFYAVLRLLRGLSQEAPRAIVIEDAHLADSASLELIQYLGTTLRGSGRLFIVCTAIPQLFDNRPGWGKGWWRHEVLTLAPVGQEGLDQLVRAVLGRRATPGLVYEILTAAHGRPGVAELLATTWLELNPDAGVASPLEAVENGDSEEQSAGSELAGDPEDVAGSDLVAHAGQASRPSEARHSDRFAVPGEAAGAGSPESDSLEDAASRVPGSVGQDAEGAVSAAVAEARAGAGDKGREMVAGGGDGGRDTLAGGGDGGRDTLAGGGDGGRDTLAGGEAFEAPLSGGRGVSLDRIETRSSPGFMPGDVGDWDEDEQLFLIEEGERDVTVIAALREIRAASAAAAAADVSRGETLGISSELGPLRTIPPGAIWAKRLAMLSPAARELLNKAAVAGRTFRSELLANLWISNNEPMSTLEPLLAELKARGFIRRRIESASWKVSWRFRGTLLHRVTYDEVGMGERYRLHRRLARLLEADRSGMRMRGSYALVAYHYDQGEDFDRALRYYVLAGKAARRALALVEGERLFARALNLLRESGFPDGGNENAVLHLLHGQILGMLNEPRRAIAELEMALEFARLRQDRRQECEVLMSLCELLDREGERSQLLEFALQARDAARAAQNARLLVRSLRQIGWEQLRAGKPEEGRAALEEAVQLAMEGGNPIMVADAMDSLGSFYYLRGNYGLAVRGYEDLLALLKRSLRPPSAARRG